MRQDNFTEQAIQLAMDYQINDQHILNFYTQNNYIKLSPLWNGFANWEKLSINATENLSLGRWHQKTVA